MSGLCVFRFNSKSENCPSLTEVCISNVPSSHDIQVHLLFPFWMRELSYGSNGFYLRFPDNVLLLDFVWNGFNATGCFKVFFQVSESSDRLGSFVPKNHILRSVWWSVHWCENGQDFKCLQIIHTSNTGQLLTKNTFRENKVYKKVRMTQLRKRSNVVTQNVIQTISFEACCFYKRWVGGGERCKGDGERRGLLVRPPGLGMLSTLHPGKGSLRSSGPICSRRGKWHIIGSRPDKGFVYITLPDTRLT